jgi:hypothetical protein
MRQFELIDFDQVNKDTYEFVILGEFWCGMCCHVKGTVTVEYDPPDPGTGYDERINYDIEYKVYQVNWDTGEEIQEIKSEILLNDLHISLVGKEVIDGLDKYRRNHG